MSTGNGTGSANHCVAILKIAETGDFLLFHTFRLFCNFCNIFRFFANSYRRNDRSVSLVSSAGANCALEVTPPCDRRSLIADRRSMSINQMHLRLVGREVMAQEKLPPAEVPCSRVATKMSELISIKVSPAPLQYLPICTAFIALGLVYRIKSSV